jgi:hypothetical protein
VHASSDGIDTALYVDPIDTSAAHSVSNDTQRVGNSILALDTALHRP